MRRWIPAALMLSALAAACGAEDVPCAIYLPDGTCDEPIITDPPDPPPPTGTDVCSTIECIANRTTAKVCERFDAAFTPRAPQPFMRGATSCDPGTLSEAAYDDALRSLDFARWITGLPPVSMQADLHPRTQACAAMMSNQGAISHTPPSNWACWSAAGAQAAGESNLSISISSGGGQRAVTDIVLGFLRDGGANNFDDVGHRRWFQSPTLGAVGFGYHSGGGAVASCYNVIGAPSGPRAGPAFIGYPSPGPFPRTMLTSSFSPIPWSISVARNAWPTSPSTVRVFRVSTEEELPLTHFNVSLAEVGYTRALVFLPDWGGMPGRYRIEVTGGLSITYETDLIDCP